MPNDSIAAMRPSCYILILFGLALLWPAFVNGAPFLFSDTLSYLHGAAVFFFKLTHHHSAWEHLLADLSSSGGTDSAASGLASQDADKSARIVKMPVELGRSIYYGLLLYSSAITGTLWTPAVVQALLTSTALLGITRHFVDPASPRTFVTAFLVALAVLMITPLPYYVSFLMPDLLTGLGLVAAAALVVGWRRETTGWRVAWAAIALFAALSHSSNVLILGALACLWVAAALVLRNWRIPVIGAVVLLCTALGGIAGESVFSLLVAKTTGAPPIRPPFLTARLVEDGPGTAFIRTHCPQSGFFLCKFAKRLPLGSDDFLWLEDPARGVYSVVSGDDRRRLAGEQMRFVAAVVEAYPGATISAAIHNAGEQIALAGLPEFNYSPLRRSLFIRAIPGPDNARVRQTRAFHDTMPTGLVAALVWPLAIASLIALLILMRPATAARLRGYAIVAVAGWVLDDIVCGCLSTPHDRYQARIIWVLPLFAVLALAARSRRLQAST